MSKQGKRKFNSIWLSSLLIAVITIQASGSGVTVRAQEQDKKEIEKDLENHTEISLPSKEAVTDSIQLSPLMILPEKTALLNQEVTREDVIRTMNLSAIRLATTAALAEIDAGIEAHLGYKEKYLTPIQIQLYNENVVYYSKVIQTAEQDAIEEQEVQDALATFTNWVSLYKTAIEENIAEEIEREKELERIKEEENKEVEITEVVDHSPTHTIPNMEHISYDVPSLDSQYLTYEPYTAITAKTTPHYKLQTLATTDSHGYRIYQEAVAVALGSAYGTTIGTLYDIEFSDGKVMRAILGDNKSDKHTDSLNQYRDATEAYNGKSGNIVEIIFDTANYPNMQSVNRKINSDYSGEVVSITKVGMAEGFGQ